MASTTPFSSLETEQKTNEDDSLILLHQQKIDELESLHAEIPLLTEALNKEPGNIAIAERLARAQDVSKDVDYLTIGPHLIIEYMNATSDQQRTELRERFYKEALLIEPPSPNVKRKQSQEPQLSSKRQNLKANENQQLKRKKPKTNIKATSSKEVKWEDAAGDCSSCGLKQCTFYTRSTGDRTCRNCGVAFQDNISGVAEWQDLSYDEKMAVNWDSKNICQPPEDQFEDGLLDEEGNPRKGNVALFGMNECHDGEGSGGNKYKYECRSYMLERLLSVQCLEHAKITAEDFQTIYATLQKHRLYSVTGWTAADMRQFLRTCKRPRLYKHVNYLLNYMSSKMPLRIDPEVQNLFIEAFDKIEVHMNKYKSMLSDYRTPERRSRPHYGYVCRQIARILGQEGLVQHFPQLISADKVLLYDAFWKKICEEVV